MSFVVAMLILLAMSLALVSFFGMNASRAPFVSIAVISLVLCLSGMAGMLMAGVVLVVVLSLTAGGFAVYRQRRCLKSLMVSFVTPGVVFFVVSSILLYVVLSVRGFTFYIWDEFSFWGIAAKQVFETRTLYTLAPGSMVNISYPPVLPLWSFFFQLFNTTFSEWQVYAAYDVMIMAVMTMLFANVKWKNAFSVLTLTAFGLVGLYQFWHSFAGIHLYAMALADIQVGVMFGAPLIAWFVTDRDGRCREVSALLGLLLLPIVKDIGFAYGLVAAVVIVADMVLSHEPHNRDTVSPGKKAIKGVWPLLLFVAVLGSYWMWSAHFRAAVSIDRVSIGYEYSIMQMLRGEDAYFIQVLHSMWKEFKTRHLVMFGPIVNMMAVFTALPLGLIMLHKSRRSILRIASFSLLMPAGYVVYALFQAYTYAAIFAHTQGASLTSFDRYMAAYPIGWMLAVVAVFCSDLWGGWRLKVGERLAGAAVCCALLFASFYFSPVHPDQYLLTSHKIVVSHDERRDEFADAAERYNLQSGERVYFASQGDDGLLWFYFNYEMQPAYVVDSIETGNFIPMDADATGNYDVPVDAARFSRYLLEHDVEYVFVYETDDYFMDEFAPLFSDHLQEEKGTLYVVSGYDADGLVQLTPAEE